VSKAFLAPSLKPRCTAAGLLALIGRPFDWIEVITVFFMSMIAFSFLFF
jgi:hypothetical protein